MRETDAVLSARFAEKMREAQAYLRAEMKRLGLSEQDGWRIAEGTRERRGGTELVLRPLHPTLEPPEGLECVVWVSELASQVDTACAPATAGAEARLTRAKLT